MSSITSSYVPRIARNDPLPDCLKMAALKFVNEGEKHSGKRARAARLERAQKVTEKWLERRGDGFRAAPDPGGVPFLAAYDWAGAVVGKIPAVDRLPGLRLRPGNAAGADGGGAFPWQPPSPPPPPPPATRREGVEEEDWTTATGDELDVAVFGEGIPEPGSGGGWVRITVFMDEEKTNTPFGMVETAPFLELLWRNTGADCAGEEEEMEFPGGSRYKVLLCESRGKL